MSRIDPADLAQRLGQQAEARPFNYLGCIDCRGRLCSLPVLAEERRDALEDQY